MIESPILTAVAGRLRAALTAQRPPHALRVDGEALGYLDPDRRRRLAGFSDVFCSHGGDLGFVPGLRTAAQRTDALEAVTRTLASEGALTAWRNERYAVARTFGAEPAFHIERAAARYFGIHTYAAHANGLVPDGAGMQIWFARRSPAKPIDPSQLDNLIGGGIPEGETPDGTLVREAWEEAGIGADIARTAQRASELYVERIVPDGLQRETIFAYDLRLPASFVPANQDGEAVEHRRVDLREAARLIGRAEGPDVVTVDASLVVLDALLRHGAVAADDPAREALAALLRRPAP